MHFGHIIGWYQYVQRAKISKIGAICLPKLCRNFWHLHKSGLYLLFDSPWKIWSMSTLFFSLWKTRSMPKTFLTLLEKGLLSAFYFAQLQIGLISTLFLLSHNRDRCQSFLCLYGKLYLCITFCDSPANWIDIYPFLTLAQSRLMSACFLLYCKPDLCLHFCDPTANRIYVYHFLTLAQSGPMSDCFYII